MEITKNTYVPDALKVSKHVSEVFRKHNLRCLKCKGIVEDTIEKVAFNNGIDLQSFLDELNKAAAKK
ncbi:MAG TPA: disulfide oxidoreductase [Spirochaetota bacterium]|nr:disulfide oxidoreductase [Spirochaetota bacterium]HPF06310.1 disulfide oxidoreductase [Spirochaetota bacterium]HPJ40907.1 disulfide oxidoreductase [Spirochaetota bacterium]HPR37744.1 disulfide oxidoreductase [Spirochaetota bacterium]HRX47757.1 disulfide oxidoreductase [Spirochaetota bacterium]